MKKYPIDFVHKLFKQWQENFWNLTPSKRNKIAQYVDMLPVKVYLPTYELFLNNTKCCHCGLEGNCYVLEHSPHSGFWHFSLYYIDENKKILFTKDHIYPKSKGGMSQIFNYQTLCINCNKKKGSRYEGN